MNVYKNILFFSLITSLRIIFDVQSLASYKDSRTIFSGKTRSVKNQKPLSPWQRWGDLTKKVYNFERSMPGFKIKSIDEKSDKKFNTSSTARYYPNIPLVSSASYHLLEKKIAEARETEKKDIENIIQEYQKKNKTSLPQWQQKDLRADLLGLSKSTEKITHSFFKKINDSIASKELNQKIIDDAIYSTKEKIYEQYSNLENELTNKNASKDASRIAEQYYYDVLKKKYTEKYYRNYINNKIKKLEIDDPQLAAQQPIIMGRNKEKDRVFYTELFNILEEMAVETVEEEEKEDGPKSTVTFESDDFAQKKDDKNFITSKINLYGLERFVKKASNEKIDAKKIEVLSNIKKSFDWINGILKKPHPSEKHASFNEWIKNIILMYIISSQKKPPVISKIMEKIQISLSEQKGYFDETKLKDAFVDGAIHYVSKDVLQKEEIKNIIKDVFIPMTIFVRGRVEQELKNREEPINIEAVTSYFQTIIQEFSENTQKALQELFRDNIVDRVKGVDKSRLKAVSEKALDDFKEKTLEKFLD